MLSDWRECVMSVLDTTNAIPSATVLTLGNKAVS